MKKINEDKLIIERGEKPFVPLIQEKKPLETKETATSITQVESFSTLGVGTGSKSDKASDGQFLKVIDSFSKDIAGELTNNGNTQKAETDKNYKLLLEKFFKIHKPSKVNDVDKLLKKFEVCLFAIYNQYISSCIYLNHQYAHIFLYCRGRKINCLQNLQNLMVYKILCFLLMNRKTLGTHL